jgi:hypothetical protein
MINISLTLDLLLLYFLFSITYYVGSTHTDIRIIDMGWYNLFNTRL